jgi:class 3 adenylate cyclase
VIDGLPYPLPDDPDLAAVAAALETAQLTAQVWDDRWRLVYSTDDFRLSTGGGIERIEPPAGEHFFSTAVLESNTSARGGVMEESFVSWARHWGPVVLADTPGGLDELRSLTDPRAHEALEGMQPADPPAAFADRVDVRYGTGRTPLDAFCVRIHRADGSFAGSAVILKPALPGSVIGMLALGDPEHFARLLSVAAPGRRATAILFADLEGSTPLSRRLSTAAYFALVRRLTRRIDERVIAAGGIIGKHVGDGVTAFFLTQHAGSDSAAARACIEAARAIQADAPGIAARSDLPPEAVTLRFGLHWGASLYVGQLLTGGHAEATAIGDEVNEAARIEACATGGRTLATKSLLERLEPDDAAALGLDPDHLAYTPLGELPGAPEKARRDAPALAVCEV